MQTQINQIIKNQVNEVFTWWSVEEVQACHSLERKAAPQSGASVADTLSSARWQQGEQAVAWVGVKILWALCRHLTSLISQMLRRCVPTIV